MLLGILFDLSLTTILILLAISFFVVIASYPLLVELTAEEEPLW